jgi:hypothetical protein
VDRKSADAKTDDAICLGSLEIPSCCLARRITNCIGLEYF